VRAKPQGLSSSLPVLNSRLSSAHLRGTRAAMTEESSEGVRSCREGERRTSSRHYEIAVLAWFRWRSLDGSMREGSGTTRNISSRGVCMSTSQPPPIGTAIEVIVGVPPLKQGTEISGQLRGVGTVLRVSEGNSFAAEVVFQLERVGASPKRSRQLGVLSQEVEQQARRSEPFL
jgi:hypothetical protein